MGGLGEYKSISKKIKKIINKKNNFCRTLQTLLPSQYKIVSTNRFSNPLFKKKWSKKEGLLYTRCFASLLVDFCPPEIAPPRIPPDDPDPFIPSIASLI